MAYVIDTSVLSAMFRNYYPGRFKTLWRLFDEMTDGGLITSVREVYREIEDRGGPELEWADKHSGLFVVPDAKEAAYVASIYGVSHFQANIAKQKLLKGGKIADPFLIARAAVTGGTVVTMEQRRPNAAKIPNICDHFSVRCLDLEGFMEERGWEF